MQESNITFASNICDAVHWSGNVFGWDEILKMVHASSLLSLSEEQRRLYRAGTRPYFCNNHDEEAWGFIKNENGNIVQSCRCEKKTCQHFQECMNEPYAKNINRDYDKAHNEIDTIISPKWTALNRE